MPSGRTTRVSVMPALSDSASASKVMLTFSASACGVSDSTSTCARAGAAETSTTVRTSALRAGAAPVPLSRTRGYFSSPAFALRAESRIAAASCSGSRVEM